MVCKNSTNTFLPGGHLEFTEDLKKTLKRELFEELGIDCFIDNYIGCVECIWEEKEIYHQEIDHVFIIKGISEEDKILSKEEHIKFYWIEIKNMEKENFLPIKMRNLVLNVYNGDNEIREPLKTMI